MNADTGRLNFATGIDNSSLQRDAEQSRNILRNIGNTAEQEGEAIDNTFKKIGKTIAGVFTIQQASSFIRTVVDIRGEVESLQKSFQVLAGKKGIPLFEEIRDFAVHTPMMMNDLAKGAQTLLSFNVAAEEVMPILRSIGDISMGDAQKFNSLTLAFAQMRSTGKLMGQDLLQMINAGFNPLAVISEQTGKSIGKLKDEMSAGVISADMITKAFMDATSEGGKFYNMLEIQSQGIQGSISNLEGAWDNVLNSIGENSQGVIVGSVQAAQKLIENYEEIGKVIAELIAVYGTYRAALIVTNGIKSVATAVTQGYTIAEIAQYNALLLVEKAQALLNKTILANPYALAAAAVAALTYGLYKYFEVEDQTKKAMSDHAEAIDKLNGKYSEEETHINSLIDIIRGETTARVERIAALNELKEIYPDIIQKYIDEKGHISDLIGLQRELNEAQAKKRLDDERGDLNEAQRYLRDYQQLQTALKNGWSWGSAGTSHNVNDLTSDMSFWKLKNSFIEEKIAYWTKRVEEQQKALEASTFNQFIANVEQMTVEQLNESRAWYDRFDELSERQVREIEAIDAELASRSPKTVKKDKSYWEEYKKQQQGMLDALTEAELSTNKAEQIRKNIAEAEGKIAAYNVKGAAKDTASNRLDSAERIEKINAYKEEVKRETELAQFEIEQADINVLENSYEKQSRQINLNYDRLIAENKKRKAEWVESLRDVKEIEWQQANPDYKKTGKVFDRESITEADLSTEQLEVLKMYERVANDYKRSENDKLLQSLLDDYATYEQKREKIAEDFARKRNDLYTIDKDGNKVFRDGVSQNNATELDRQEEEALKAIDEQFAQREVAYQAWCEEIASLSLEELQDVLTKAEEELKELEKSGTADSNQIAVARAKVSTARNKVEKEKAKADLSPNKRSIKEWEDLYKVLNECNRSFEEIGDTVGGVAGEIMSAAGGIMTSTLSVVNGIVQLVQMSSAGMQGTATAAATAISTVEKASVILTVISAALQIAMKIVDLFNTDDDKQKEIENLQGRIDQLQWELDNADITRLRENAINSLEQTKKVMTEVTLELFRQRMALNDINGAISLVFGGVTKDSEALIMSTERLAAAYTNVAYSANKPLGKERYKQAENDLRKIAEQQLLIQEQIELEQGKKKTDSGVIEDYERQIEELGAKAIEMINEIVEDIIGGSSSEIANELAEAFFEAFEAGEDAAEAWGDKVNEIVADILKRMMVQKFLEEPLGDIFDKYKKKWFPDGGFAGLDAVINSMNGFASDLNSVGRDFAAIWDTLPDSIKNMFSTVDVATREASDKGIATASQESVDELNGRATAIQGHTYSISENTKLLVANSSAILESVMRIESNTESIDRRMEQIEDSVNQVKDSVNDMSIKGIKIK